MGKSQPIIEIERRKWKCHSSRLSSYFGTDDVRCHLVVAYIELVDDIPALLLSFKYNGIFAFVCSCKHEFPEIAEREYDPETRKFKNIELFTLGPKIGFLRKDGLSSSSIRSRGGKFDRKMRIEFDEPKSFYEAAQYLLEEVVPNSQHYKKMITDNKTV